MEIQYIKDWVAQQQQQIIGYRQHIHAHPELSFAEHNTAQYVQDLLQSWGVSTQRMAGTGVIAHIQGRNPQARCIALRADMDALPILEQNTAAYTSQNHGVMHACGHDAHTACLLGAAHYFATHPQNFEGTLKLIFQPGEEKHPGGASLLINEGVLNNPTPQKIIALHVHPPMQSGTVGFRQGLYMASADEIYITIHGKGGHAALPHQTIDPIVIAAQLITSLQTLVSRRANAFMPTVLSFGKIAGGTTTNVIPETVEILGTLRTMDEEWRLQLHQLIIDQAHGICQSMGATCTIEIPMGYPCLHNHPQTTLEAQKLAEQLLGTAHVQELEQRMAAEDFSYYTHQIPGCFFRLGTNLNNNQFTYPVHHPKFDIHAEALGTGVLMFIYLGTHL